MKNLVAIIVSFFVAQNLIIFNIVYSQTLTPEFVNAGYTLTDLGSVNDLPAQYGGLTIRPEEPNRLYIGGSANQPDGAIYAVALARDPETHHITGFAGDAGKYVDAPNNDGGLYFAPNGTLLFTRYSMNELGQILPDDSYVSIPLNGFGIASSVGSLAIVPSGYPGAGNMIMVSYNASIIYHVPFTISGDGQYDLANQVAEVSVLGSANGPEGIAYIPLGSAGFPDPSMVISAYGLGKVVVYGIGENGLPDPSTARDMVTGLSGAEGALIDPVTGDFLFSTFGGGNKIIRISGFVAPSAVGNVPATDLIHFDVFPNPTNGPVTVELKDKESRYSAEVYTLSGEKLLDFILTGSGNFEIDLSDQPDGIYLIRIEKEGMITYRRVIKQ